MKNITKTSKQAQEERAIKARNMENRCPECNKSAIGVITHRQTFFKMEKMNKYTCFDCGCEWNTGWKRI